MKRQPLLLRGTPVAPCFLLIGTVILAYLNLYTDNGTWHISLDSLSFEGLSAYEIYGKIMLMAIPASLFLTVLFLGEKSLRWCIVGLAVPVVWQLSNFIYYFETPDALLGNLLQYVFPFLALIFYILAAEGILSKWLCAGISFGMALTPPIITLLGMGEFLYDVTVFDYNLYQDVSHHIVDWSTVLYWALYYASLGALSILMRDKAPESAPEEIKAPEEEEKPEEV